MTDYGVWTAAEKRYRRELEAQEWPVEEASVAILFATRQLVRPRNGAIDWLRAFPGLEETTATADAVNSLETRGLLVQSSVDGILSIHASESLHSEVMIGVAAAGAELDSPRSPPGVHIGQFGQISSPEAYGQFLECLRHAQREVTFVGFRPGPESGAAHVLKARAVAGVDVRVLLATNEQIAELWGYPQSRAFANYVTEWLEIARSNDNVEIRFCRSTSDLRFGSACLVDGRTLCMSVFDYRHQQPLDGQSLTITRESAMQPNLFQSVASQIELAWKLGRRDRIGVDSIIWLAGYWRWSLAAVFAFFAVTTLPNEPAWSGILGSIAATFAINALADSGDRIRSTWSRFVNRLTQ